MGNSFFQAVVVMKIIASIMGAVVNGIKGFFNLFASGIEQHNRELRNIEKRGVYEITNILPFANIIGTEYSKSRIVLGESKYKYSVVEDFINRVHNTYATTVILHPHDNDVAAAIKNKFNDAIIVDQNNTKYDLLQGLKGNEISKLLFDCAKNSNNIDDCARSYLNAITYFFEKRGIHPTFRGYSCVEPSKIYDYIQKYEISGFFSKKDVELMVGNLSEGQRAASSLMRYLEDLRLQMGSVLFNKATDKVPPINILDIGNSGKVIVIDVVSNHNKFFIEALLTQFIRLSQMGRTVNVICFDLNMNNKLKLQEYITDNSNSGVGSLMLVYKDLFSSCGNEALFYTILGCCEDKVLFRHNQGRGVNVLAKSIGYYEKEEEHIVHTKGKTSSFITLFPDYQTSIAVDIEKKMKLIIEPSELLKLKPNEAYVYNAKSGELVHAYLNG